MTKYFVDTEQNELDDNYQDMFYNSNMTGLIDRSSRTWYYINSEQFTMPIPVLDEPEENSPNGSYMDLTEQGRSEYRQALQKAYTNMPTAYLLNAFLQPTRCGSWIADIQSIHYSPEDPRMIMCHMADRVLVGQVRSDPERSLTTSLVRWFGQLRNGQKWVITRSGSLYYYE